MLARGAARGCSLLTHTHAPSKRHASTVVLAALVERLPSLVPEQPAWAQEAAELREQVAVASAKQYPAEYIDAEEGPDRKQAREHVAGLVEREASRLGSADADDDEHSLDRRLAQRLYLLHRVDGKWQFPQARWQPDASGEAPGLRETVSGALTASCGEGLDLHFVGNAPMAHWQRKPEDETHFFFRVQLLGGSVAPASGVECAWLPKEQLAERLQGSGEGLSPLVLEMCGPHD